MAYKLHVRTYGSVEHWPRVGMRFEKAEWTCSGLVSRAGKHDNGKKSIEVEYDEDNAGVQESASNGMN